MSGRNWVIALAFGLIAGLTIFLPVTGALLDGEGGYSYEASSRDEHSDREIGGRSTEMASEDRPNGAFARNPNYDYRTELGENWEEVWSKSDTIAQWLMAFAALATVVLLLVTIRLTARTLWEAQSATAAANAAVDTTREIGRQQLRAYVSAEAFHVTFQRPPSGISPLDMLTVIVRLRVKNWGKPLRSIFGSAGTLKLFGRMRLISLTLPPCRSWPRGNDRARAGDHRK